MVPRYRDRLPGTDIVEAIERILDGADVVLAVIGPDWFTEPMSTAPAPRSRDRHGADRAVDPRLRRPGPVIPVLVGGAIMPQPDELQSTCAALARRTPIELRDTSWAADVERLRETVRPLGPPPDDRGRRRLRQPANARDHRHPGRARRRTRGRRVPVVSDDDGDDGGSTTGPTTTSATTQETEPATTEEPATTAEAPTTEQATTEPAPPTTTASAAPDLSAVLFQDSLAPASDAFVSGPADEGCTFTPGPDGYEIAVAAETVCSAAGFLDEDALPDAALTVTAALPPGAPAPAAGEDVDVAARCSATDSSDYLATIGPDGAFELLRRTDVSGAPRGTRLASGTADGVNLANGAIRFQITCTTSDAGVRVQVAAGGDDDFINAIDPDPLPPGLPTFGASRRGDGSFAVVYTSRRQRPGSLIGLHPIVYLT